ncbi:MAG: proliferating cell nuclear antigen (pcna) [archaeon]
MGMELVLENAQDFRRSIDAISVLIDEAEFVIDEKSLSLKATDPSQISLVDYSLPKSAFKQYKVDETRKIGVDLDYLAQIVSRAKPKDELQLSLDEDGSRLNLVFKGESVRRFSIPLIDVSSSDIPAPKIDFDASVKISADVLQDGLKDAALVSTHITVGVSDRDFYLRASSSKGELNHVVSKKDKALVELSVKKECNAMFPLDYLSDMLKAASANSHVELELKSNAPIRVSYSVGQAKITYFLAPRIENP